MKRGNLIIYDKVGKIFSQTGEAEGDILPHEYPEGLPYIEVPHGTMNDKKVISVDVSTDPHEVIFETIEKHMSYEELETELLIAQGVI